MYAVALHVTNPILSLPVVAGPQSEAVPSIMPRPWVVTLRVTLTVPNLSNATVAEDKPLTEARVLHGVDTQIQTDVVRAKSLSQSPVLEVDLGCGHSGVVTIVVGEVDNAVANSLVCTKLPVVVVAKDDVGVVARCETAGWRKEGRDKLWFRDRSGDDGWMKANFVWGPQLFHLKV